MTKVAYCRVSTVGQTYAEQVKEVRTKGVAPKNIYHEKFTGTTVHRPQFEKMMNRINSGDTLYVTRLDRFARNASDATSTLKDLMDNGINIDVLHGGVGFVPAGSKVGKLVLEILSDVAEFEHDLILHRTAEGRAEANRQDRNISHKIGRRYSRFGRKARMANPKLRPHYLAIYHDFNKIGATKVAKKYGLKSRPSVYKTVKAVKRWLKYNKKASA